MITLLSARERRGPSLLPGFVLPSAHQITIFCFLEVGSDNRTKDMSVDMAAQNPMKLWGDNTLTFDDCLVARSSKQAARPYPVGKVVGGGSAINGMGAIRGHPDDFDQEWAKITSDDSWGWKNMLGAYKKLEYDPLYNDPKYTKFPW